MFKFIKKLFKKEKEPETTVMDVEEEIPEVVTLNEEQDNIRRQIAEESIARAQKVVDMKRELDNIYDRLGIVYKFRDTTTGEIHIVKASDHETFNRMMGNGNMQLVFD